MISGLVMLVLQGFVPFARCFRLVAQFLGDCGSRDNINWAHEITEQIWKRI